jgi:hypothetical protein
MFSNTMADVNISMADFEKYSVRKPFYEQTHLDATDSRFEHFNYFPGIASKYETHNAPDFEKYAPRTTNKKEIKAANNA